MRTLRTMKIGKVVLVEREANNYWSDDCMCYVSRRQADQTWFGRVFVTRGVEASVWSTATREGCRRGLAAQLAEMKSALEERI